jgi:hypothetical protein
MYVFSSVAQSETYCYGSVSADPYLWLTDPDSAPDAAPNPAIFVSDLQDGNKNYFSKIKSHKKSQKVGTNLFLTILAPDPYVILMDPAPVGPKTNGSYESGSATLVFGHRSGQIIGKSTYCVINVQPVGRHMSSYQGQVKLFSFSRLKVKK